MPGLVELAARIEPRIAAAPLTVTDGSAPGRLCRSRRDAGMRWRCCALAAEGDDVVFWDAWSSAGRWSSFGRTGKLARYTASRPRRDRPDVDLPRPVDEAELAAIGRALPASGPPGAGSPLGAGSALPPSRRGDFPFSTSGSGRNAARRGRVCRARTKRVVAAAATLAIYGEFDVAGRRVRFL